MVSVTIIVVGVLAFAALLGWWLLREMTSADRMERDPQYRGRVMRRLMLSYCVLGAVGIVFWAVQLAMGEPPREILYILIMALLNVLMAIRIGRNLKKTPPV